MEVSALRYQGAMGLHGCSPLLRLQSDERLIALIRRGNAGAFEVLVGRYHSRLLAFCRHMLGSKEDAEDVLQEVMAAAYNAILADERPINVRPWLYRIARNRSLNHLRRIQAIGVDSMDVHYSEFGATTADKVHEREQFRVLVRDIQSLPETQRTALVLREMDALSYDQIAEAMDTTVPGVKSLLVRARISLAEAAEARQLSCDEVRIELAEVAEGLRKRPAALVRRHLRSCTRCESFHGQLKQTNKALAALLPIGPLALLRQLVIAHIGHGAGTGTGAASASSAAGAAGAGGATAGAGVTTATAGATGVSTTVGVGSVAAGQAAAVAGTAAGSATLGSAGGLVSVGAGALATKAAAGLAAAAIVTAGAVEASHVVPPTQRPKALAAATGARASGGAALTPAGSLTVTKRAKELAAQKQAADARKTAGAQSQSATPTTPAGKTASTPATASPTTPSAQSHAQKTTTGRTQVQTDATVLSSSAPVTPTNGGTATDTSGSGSIPTGTTTTTTSTTPTPPPGGSSDGSGGTTTTTTTTDSGSGSTTTTGAPQGSASGGASPAPGVSTTSSGPSPSVPPPASP